MLYAELGKSGEKVSKLCLGSMTFGQQNTLQDAFDQLDFAYSRGINFIDTAEMYPVPANPLTQGKTEIYVGEWFKSSGKRKEMILATKVTGPGIHTAHISKNLGFSKSRMKEALEKSLQRLQTDYIDIYQLHWPERKTNCFGKLGYVFDADDMWQDNISEIVEILYQFKSEGKIRFWGISNETPWGLMRFLQESKKYNDFPLVSIQNPYNLVNRTFEIGLAEMVMRENIGFLAYSPLAFGLLSGKYHKNISKSGDRLNQFKQMARYNGKNTYDAVGKYLSLADDYKIPLAQMSLSYILTKPFVSSVILGATQVNQLKENIESLDLMLSKEIMEGIESIHKEISNPAP